MISALSSDIYWLFAPPKYRENYVKANRILEKALSHLNDNEYFNYWVWEKRYRADNWKAVNLDDAWDDFEDNEEYWDEY